MRLLRRWRSRGWLLSVLCVTENHSHNRQFQMPGLLEIGLELPLYIREERLSPRLDACRLLYISDIHLRCGRSDRLCLQVIESVQHCKPHAVLLGGDLVDGPSELSRLSDLIGGLSEVAPVLAIGGNHDRDVGINRVRDAVVNGGGQWIHAEIARVTHGSRVISAFEPSVITSLEQ